MCEGESINSRKIRWKGKIPAILPAITANACCVPGPGATGVNKTEMLAIRKLTF